MTQPDLTSAFEQLGLTRQEAVSYVAALKLGIAKASEIAAKAGINREASYYVLRMLKEKGFVGEVIKGGVKHYSAISPKRIGEILEEEKTHKLSVLEDVLPDLESLQKIAMICPTIEIYEGVAGMKTAASRIVEKKNQVIRAYMHESVLKFIPTFNPQFRRRRREQNIFMKIITHKTNFTLNDLKKKDKEELRETRFTDSLMADLDIAYYILDDAIIIVKANEKEQMGMYIKEPGTALLQQRIFDSLWNQAVKK